MRKLKGDVELSLIDVLMFLSSITIICGRCSDCLFSIKTRGINLQDLLD